MTYTEQEFANKMFDTGLFIKTDIEGVYGIGKNFYHLIMKLKNYLSNIGNMDGAEVMMFPPIMSRNNLIKNGYLNSFPHLLGSINTFKGNNEVHQQMLQDINKGEKWEQHLSTTDVVMTPAACHPVYPHLKGILPSSGRIIEVASYCFRHEPSTDPGRLMSFNMFEFVCAASENQVMQWREEWFNRAQNILLKLELTSELIEANDPFFGSGARLLISNQKSDDLKFEMVATITSTKPTAIISFNYHKDYFSMKHEIKTESGENAHTACVGFGIERLGMALISKHGFYINEWPEQVKNELELLC